MSRASTRKLFSDTTERGSETAAVFLSRPADGISDGDSGISAEGTPGTCQSDSTTSGAVDNSPGAGRRSRASQMQVSTHANEIKPATG